MYSVFAIDDLPMYSARSTERQRRSILVVGHPREIVSGIDVLARLKKKSSNPCAARDRSGPMTHSDHVERP